MTSDSKVQRPHLQRTAMIYVRQSTLAQVRQHTESTSRQYGLSSEAVRLGWTAAQVEVIDTDLGLSGRSAGNRAGFKDMLGRVCAGEVGAIFGLEVSRLARSSADLQRLLEVCGVTDTLIVDSDGIYDLSDFNDRLLLGLKGTMSEAELHLLCTHGILHLLGFDHDDADEEREMFDLQARILADWEKASGLGPIRVPLPGTGGEARDAAGGGT